MRYLSVSEVLSLHQALIEQSGGSPGVRDYAGLESAVAQPQMTLGGVDHYPGVVDKAVALGFSLICNHPFVDGNKRIGHAAMEVFLVLNAMELDAPVDEQERIILSVAAGQMGREEFAAWVQAHAKDRAI